MEGGLKLENIAIVLVEPQIPENIGSAARAMNNMGLDKLILVRPKNLDREKILKVATGHSSRIVNQVRVFDNLRECLEPFGYVAGTTARVGSSRPALSDPRRLARELISVSHENSIAVIFGPEDRGLSNKHLRYCHTITTIPTSDFSSINLAQAVMIICYEIFIARNDPPVEVVPRLANKFELEGMYDHIQDILSKIGFLNPQNPEKWMLNIRRICNSFPLKAKDARVIRGICRQIEWYAGKRENNSKMKAEKNE
ncbi:MAG: RNA methyltransferase [Deltaproteobacteria bacterium]|nr:RNA methyltransferase [Deltaproteobacteria bacterium]